MAPLPLSRLAIWLLWLAMATGAIVFREPAPFDVLMLGLLVLLPLLGLVQLTRPILLLAGAWLLLAALGFFSALGSPDMRTSTVFVAVTLFLSAISVVLAGFVAQDPAPRVRLLLTAYSWGAVIATLAAVIGYFDLLPGAGELFTRYGRARGTFKDPNVYAPFLVPALIYLMHLALNRPLRRALIHGGLALFLFFGLLLSFSRGGWANFALAALLYGYLAFLTSPTHWGRLKLLALVAFGALGIVGLLAVALQFETVAALLAERASLTQSYDLAPGGRFAAQALARQAILDNPFGIGAYQFSKLYHVEDPHNVYLNMFLTGGWLSGLLYLAIILASLWGGLMHIFRRPELRGPLLVVYAAFAGVAAEGIIIDTDHWRHFFVLIGLLWGLMGAPAKRTLPASPPRS